MTRFNLCIFAGAFVGGFAGPWATRHVPITVFGAMVTGALVAGVGAVAGGMFAERMGWRRR